MNFKHYNQQQTILLPYSFDDLIPEKHPVRVIDQIVESLNIQPLLRAYSKEGNPAYHPKMLLKVMLYAKMLSQLEELWNSAQNIDNEQDKNREGCPLRGAMF